MPRILLLLSLFCWALSATATNSKLLDAIKNAHRLMDFSEALVQATSASTVELNELAEACDPSDMHATNLLWPLRRTLFVRAMQIRAFNFLDKMFCLFSFAIDEDAFKFYLRSAIESKDTTRMMIAEGLFHTSQYAQYAFELAVELQNADFYNTLNQTYNMSPHQLPKSLQNSKSEFIASVNPKCSICLYPVADEESLFACINWHKFHKACLLSRFKDSMSCPICCCMPYPLFDFLVKLDRRLRDDKNLYTAIKSFEYYFELLEKEEMFNLASRLFSLNETPVRSPMIWFVLSRLSNINEQDGVLFRKAIFSMCQLGSLNFTHEDAELLDEFLDEDDEAINSQFDVALATALLNGKGDLAKYLVSKGIKLDFRQLDLEYIFSHLKSAGLEGSTLFVSYCLHELEGAPKAIRNNCLNFAVKAAAKYCKTTCLELLRCHGANIEILGEEYVWNSVAEFLESKEIASKRIFDHVWNPHRLGVDPSEMEQHRLAIKGDPISVRITTGACGDSITTEIGSLNTVSDLASILIFLKFYDPNSAALVYKGDILQSGNTFVELQSKEPINIVIYPNYPNDVILKEELLGNARLRIIDDISELDND